MSSLSGRRRGVFVFLALLISPCVGVANEPLAAPSIQWNESPPPWSARFIPYGWLPGLHGDLTVRGVTAPVDVEISKTWDLLWNNLEGMFIGQMEARNGQVGFLVNNVYAKFALDNEIRRLDFSSELSMLFLDIAGTYELTCLPDYLHLPCGSRVELLAGARYNSLRAGLSVTGPLGNTVSEEGRKDWWDPIVGFRARVPFGPCWTSQLRADVGGFGIGEASHFVWNIEATLEYQWSERISLMAGYRVLDIDRTTGSGNQRFGFDMNLNGPMMGIAINF